MDAEEMGMTTEELLGEVKTAIRTVLVGGQSYKIGSRQVTRADLSQLRELKKELEQELASTGTGDLFDNTSVAFFEGR